MASRSSLAFAPTASASASAFRSACVSPLANLASASENRADASSGFFASAFSSWAAAALGSPARESTSPSFAAISLRSGLRFWRRFELGYRPLPVVSREGAIEVHLRIGIELLDPGGHRVGFRDGALLVERLQVHPERIQVVRKAGRQIRERAHALALPAQPRVDRRQLLVHLRLVGELRGELPQRLDGLHNSPTSSRHSNTRHNPRRKSLARNSSRSSRSSRHRASSRRLRSLPAASTPVELWRVGEPQLVDWL